MSKNLCGQHAAFRYTWPGRDESHICAEHAMQLQNVANAMGLYVQLIPLSYGAADPIPSEFPTCKQVVKEPS